jgi:nucleoid DNA-binding protein
MTKLREAFTFSRANIIETLVEELGTLKVGRHEFKATKELATTVLDAVTATVQKLLSRTPAEGKLYYDGVGTFKVKARKVWPVKPITAEEKAAGVTMESKRAGIKQVVKKVVGFKPSLDIRKLLNK